VENHQIHLKHFVFAVQKSAKLKKWTSKEVNGLIFIWHHAENENPWELKFFKQIESREWVFYGKNEYVINCHIQDIPENGADVGRLISIEKSFHFYLTVSSFSSFKLISDPFTVRPLLTAQTFASHVPKYFRLAIMIGMQS
jgi:hypothetical protein